MRYIFIVLLMMLMPVLGTAQTGRLFVSAEASVGQARIVHVGKIVELELIEYGKPLTDKETLGKRPFRIVFEVSETIRGDEVKRLELVLLPGIKDYLEYMRDHSLEVILISGPGPRSPYPYGIPGIEEQGRRTSGVLYEFRALDPLKVPEPDTEPSIEKTINAYFDSGRMFTHELGLVAGREAILGRMRAFAKQHTEVLGTVTLAVPREFAKLCGDPNAGPFISLPLCPETKATLVALKNDPGLVMRQINSQNQEIRSRVLVEVDKALSSFPPPITPEPE